MLGLNEKQWQLIYQSLVGMSGPLAKVVSLFFDMDATVVKAKIDAALTLVAALTPIISIIWMVATSKAKDQLASVAAMPAEQVAAAAAALPAQAVVGLVTAMPDRAIVTAAGSLDGVSVTVDRSASRGALSAAHDASVPNVNPA